MRKSLNKHVYRDLMAIFGMSYSPHALVDDLPEEEKEGDDEDTKMAK